MYHGGLYASTVIMDERTNTCVHVMNVQELIHVPRDLGNFLVTWFKNIIRFDSTLRDFVFIKHRLEDVYLPSNVLGKIDFSSEQKALRKTLRNVSMLLGIKLQIRVSSDCSVSKIQQYVQEHMQ